LETGREITLSEAAEILGGTLIGPDSKVNRFCSLDKPQSGAIAFVEKPGRLDHSLTPLPSGLIVGKQIEHIKDIGQIVVDNPRLAFVKMMQFFHPPSVVEEDFRHPSAIIAENAVVGIPAYIGPGCVIECDVVIESGCRLVSDVYIGARTKIGNNCLIHTGVKLLNDVRIGHRCIIGPGTVIGSDGFGFIVRGEEILKVPQVGTVVIGDDVELGANVTIDRATIDATIIGDMTKIDNLVQIAHNVHVGKRVRIAAQCGLAGGVTIGDDVVMGGQVGVGHGITIGSRVMIGAQAGVTRDFSDDIAISGYPAREHRHMLMVEAACQRLPELFKRYGSLLREMEKVD